MGNNQSVHIQSTCSPTDLTYDKNEFRVPTQSSATSVNMTQPSNTQIQVHSKRPQSPTNRLVGGNDNSGTDTSSRQSYPLNPDTHKKSRKANALIKNSFKRNPKAPELYVLPMTRDDAVLLSRLQPKKHIEFRSQLSLANVDAQREAAIAENKKQKHFRKMDSSVALEECFSKKHCSDNHLAMRHGIGVDDTIEEKLGKMGCQMITMIGDGNCLFRAAAYNLFGDQEQYMYVRKKAVAIMNERKDTFGIYFENDEFKQYLNDMKRNATWGDELCVRAIADAFCCTVHIVSSTPENWYLKYTPFDDDGNDVSTEKHLFFTYIFPIHYNAFHLVD